MKLPESTILYLYNGNLNNQQLNDLNLDSNFISNPKDEDVYWLNTPGPIYTTQTDNCGTGQPEAPNNVGGDEDYYEFIFKPPFNTKELEEIKSAAFTDPFGSYYFNGNYYWTNQRIIKWWSKIESIIDYMILRYQEELKLPSNPHNTLYDFGEGIVEAHFYGPSDPLPKNYKSALDFYQNELKEYLEWYMEYNNGSSVELDILDYDWTNKKKLDEELKKFNPVKRDLIKEHNQNQEKSKSVKINKKINFWNKFKKRIK